MLKVPDELDQVLVAKTFKAEQEHVFRFWAQLGEDQRRALLDQLAKVDFQLLARLIKRIEVDHPPREGLKPLAPLTLTPERRVELEALGWSALERGKVACLMVAGGQGTRLGWSGPKGTYPVAPVSDKSLYQLFAEQVLSTAQRAGKPLPWYVLTSRLNREATEGFFRENGHFGLDPKTITFLVQADLPNTDLRGKLLQASTCQVATSPNGHGGTLSALWEAGVLEAMAERGNDYLFYWQVDNPLCRVADPVFLGAHIEQGAEASTKVVKKVDPREKIGLLGLHDDKTTVIEYSEMTSDQQAEREDDGELVYRAGNTAIHLFSGQFLSRLKEGGFELGYHLARKPVSCVDDQGEVQESKGVKFETFIFDVLAEATTHIALEVERDEEFEPLKNCTGPYSPKTVKAAQSERHRRWLLEAGHDVPAGTVCEVSPLTALDPEELKNKVSELPAIQDGTLVL